MLTWSDTLSERKTLTKYMQKLHRRRFDNAAAASISLRLDSGLFLVAAATPNGGPPSAEAVGLYDLDGKNLGPTQWTTDDIGLHRAVLLARSDARAVFHAQPPYATAFAAAGKVVNTAVTQETWLGLGDVAVAPYNPRRTIEMANACVDALGQWSSALLIRGLGALTVGESLDQAFRKMQLMEMAAQLSLLVGRLGVEDAGLSAGERRAAEEV